VIARFHSIEYPLPNFHQIFCLTLSISTPSIWILLYGLPRRFCWLPATWVAPKDITALYDTTGGFWQEWPVEDLLPQNPDQPILYYMPVEGCNSDHPKINTFCSILQALARLSGAPSKSIRQSIIIVYTVIVDRDSVNRHSNQELWNDDGGR